MDIILIAFFCFRLYKLAKNYGLSPWRWVLTGGWVMLAMVLSGSVLFMSVANVDPLLVKEYLEKNEFPAGVLNTLVLMLLFMVGCAFLGYVLVKNQMARAQKQKLEN